MGWRMAMCIAVLNPLTPQVSEWTHRREKTLTRLSVVVLLRMSSRLKYLLERRINHGQQI
jgi:hypothetical protein